MIRNGLDKAFRANIMNEDLEAARFETFMVRPGTETIYRETKRFAETFTPGQIGIIGYGNPGNGKSHLFAAVHHHVDNQGYTSLFIDCSRLFQIVSDASKYSSKINIADVVNGAVGADLLTLDELGCRKITSDEYDVLFTIINGRQGKTTNGTTNLDLDELQQWLSVDKYKQPLDVKGRLIDRILGSCDVLENNGSSYRIEKAMNRMGNRGA
jgi:DNA replication protein DnaC